LAEGINEPLIDETGANEESGTEIENADD